MRSAATWGMLGVALMLAHAAGAAGPPGVLSWNFDENVPIGLLLALDRPARVTLSGGYAWSGGDWDRASYFHAVNLDDGALFQSLAGTSQATAEADLAFLGHDGNVAPLFAASVHDGFWTVSFDHLRPGNWSIVTFGGASSPLANVSYAIATDPPARVAVAVGSPVEFRSVRDFGGGPHASLRGVGGGALAAHGATSSLSAALPVYGFSAYVPGEGDIHQFTVEGPGVAGPADLRTFLGAAPGTYHYALDAASAGTWPGAAWVLMAGIDLPWT